MPCGNHAAFAQRRMQNKCDSIRNPLELGFWKGESAILIRRYSVCIESSLFCARQQSLDILLKPVFVNHADVRSGNATLLVDKERVWHVANAICLRT
jgi:hypothetical protein